MRIRSRTSHFLPADHYFIGTNSHYTNGSFPDFDQVQTADTSWISYPSEISVIGDVVKSYREGDPRRKAPVDGNGKTVIVTDPITNRTHDLLWGAKDCDHDTTKIKFEKNIDITHARVSSPGNPIYERVDSRTIRFADGLQLVHWFNSDVAAILDGHSANYSSTFINHDWFALMDKFNEMQDQYIPSGLLAGESMVEHEIFVEAFKTLFNPSRAVKFFFSVAKGIKNIRKMNLRTASHHIAKQSSNSYLTYAFGIRPAIHDIIDTLDAHSKVTSRLKYLRDNAGQFVPIRASQKLDSFMTEEPEITPGASDDLRWYDYKHTSTAVISALGRVRDDISFTNDWVAYLQYFGINKVVGLAWELIPFSFVIDWFTNAQERINSLTRLRTGGPFVEFRNLCHSVKKNHSERLYFLPGRDTSFGGPCTSPDFPVLVATRDVVQYHRHPGIPNTSGVLDFGTLGLFHAITGAALVIQRT